MYVPLTAVALVAAAATTVDARSVRQTATVDCTGIPVWVPSTGSAGYNGGAKVQKDNIAYQAAWWVNSDPAVATANGAQWSGWNILGRCSTDASTTAAQKATTTTTQAPTTTTQAPSTTQATTTTTTQTVVDTTTTQAPTTTTTTQAITTTTTQTSTTATAQVTTTSSAFVSGHAKCRPESLYKTEGVDVPYCTSYDENGRELLSGGHKRRVIAYFTSWRTGANGQPAFLANQVPWEHVTHINYAFAHVGADNRVSVGPENDPQNAAVGPAWPGVDVDPSLGFKGHFGALATYKKRFGVKTLVSIGGWAETGGFFGADGKRVASGGFYTLTTNADGSVNTAGINTFAQSCADFIRKYKFDGVDIDYEYPTSMNDAGNPDDFAISNAKRATLWPNYVVLMKTLRKELDRASAADGIHYLLTIASPSSGYMLRGMELMQVTPFLDYVNLMTYDLHGAWNDIVGHNAALFDTGRDAELAQWNVYGTEAYKGIGYLNTDWAYHYFRGTMAAGRINIGVPYYTRGWQGVTSGEAGGLWGRAALPLQSECPTGTGVGDKNKCGNGATGIDNLWHDLDMQGREMGAGSNPMWHAKNLEVGVYGTYLKDYSFPATGALNGTYQRFYDSVAVAPWLWNDQKKTFLSTEDAESMARKIKYVNDNAIGGLMMWELAGDYKCYARNADGTRGAVDPTENACKSKNGEYFFGNTLTKMMSDAFKASTPMGVKVSPNALPASAVNIGFSITGFKVGDQNYPLNPTLYLKNNMKVALPGGTEFQFSYGTSCPENMADQNGAGLKVIAAGHTGMGNVGGLRGDFQRVSFKTPAWKTIAVGDSMDVALNYYLPITTPSDWRVNIDGTWYALAQEFAHIPVASM